MQRYAYTTRYTYNKIVRNGAKNFTAQYVANKRNKCEYICFIVVNVIMRTIKTRSDYKYLSPQILIILYK